LIISYVICYLAELAFIQVWLKSKRNLFFSYFIGIFQEIFTDDIDVKSLIDTEV